MERDPRFCRLTRPTFPLHVRRPAAKRSGGYQRIDLFVGRKSAKLFLREPQLAVHGDLENTAAGFDELNLGARLLYQPVPRTEGFRFVVSLDTIFDGHLHADNSVRPSYGIPYHVP